MVDLTMAMTRKRIAEIEQKSAEAVTEARRLLRDARLAKAKLEGKPQPTFIWSRWSNLIRRVK